jgi:GTPase
MYTFISNPYTLFAEFPYLCTLFYVMSHKSGFVNILGKPNVGKSTLMNALVGQKLSIVTYKAQTTRHRILGIVNGDDFQIVYSDTPGILKPAYKLQETMMKAVDLAFADADIFLYVIESGEEEIDAEVVAKLNKTKRPVVIALNKIDLSEQDQVQVKIDHWQIQLPTAIIIPVSALHKFNMERLFDVILENLPESEPYFPKDELTDKPMRFFISEIVREKILLHYRKEVPYSVEVIVESYVDEEKIIKIGVVIYVARESQRPILIGEKGLALKRVGIEARKDIEEFAGKKVFLELFVKVQKDWRDDDGQLKKFGYLNS